MGGCNSPRECPPFSPYISYKGRLSWRDEAHKQPHLTRPLIPHAFPTPLSTWCIALSPSCASVASPFYAWVPSGSTTLWCPQAWRGSWHPYYLICNKICLIFFTSNYARLCEVVGSYTPQSLPQLKVLALNLQWSWMLLGAGFTEGSSLQPWPIPYHLHHISQLPTPPFLPRIYNDEVSKRQILSFAHNWFDILWLGGSSHVDIETTTLNLWWEAQSVLKKSCSDVRLL